MKIDTRLDGGLLTVSPEGRIDSTNAAEADAAIAEAMASGTFDRVEIDADRLVYLSSAGLRVLLKVCKKCPRTSVVNVSPDVYDVLEMTGFTEMMEVRKQYRTLSVEDCEVIGMGASGKVYRLDPETILKVYFNPDALGDIRRERELARKAFVLGVPTAISYDVVRVGESYGSVFELLNAQTIAKAIAQEPDQADRYIGMYADLLKLIHSTQVKPGDMPDAAEVALKWVSGTKGLLPDPVVEKLDRLVRAVPERHTMIHGDYHIKNVMIQNGEALLIDMDSLSEGDPIFEFAAIFNDYIGYYVLDHHAVEDFLGIDYATSERIWKETLRLYFGTDDPAVTKAAEEKASLLGYTRLLRRLHRHGEDQKNPELFRFYRDQVLTLIDRVDSLSFT